MNVAISRTRQTIPIRQSYSTKQLASTIFNTMNYADRGFGIFPVPYGAMMDACVEDKIVQRAVVMILERIDEVDFCDASYGFRPDRSCHQALSVLGEIIATPKVNWIADANIKGFFDNVSHSSLLELLKKRIDDQRMLRLIERFLHAGVMIDEQRHDTDAGAPQGSVLSPLLANVYLHYVLDRWFER